MRTCVYIDGYNLYFGCLYGSTYKWLDLVKLFDKYIVSSHEQKSSIVSVKYFTSPSKDSISNTPGSRQRQDRYHKALRYQDNRLEIIFGYHQESKTSGWTLDANGERERCRSKVIVIEEKQTDVNIALAMYADVVAGRIDHIVLCSNDADLEPALRRVREEFPKIKIGLVIPRHPGNQGRKSERLARCADWIRSEINQQELAGSQLPSDLKGHRNCPIKKPELW